MADMMDLDEETWETLLWWPEAEDKSFRDILGNPTAESMPKLFM